MHWPGRGAAAAATRRSASGRWSLVGPGAHLGGSAVRGVRRDRKSRTDLDVVDVGRLAVRPLLVDHVGGELGAFVRGQLLLIVDDVNCGLLGGGCGSVDTDVISHQVCLLVLAKALLRRDKSTSSRASNLIMLPKFGLTLGFVGALLLVLVVRVVYLHRRVRLFLGKKLVQAFGSRIEGGTSVGPLGRGNGGEDTPQSKRGRVGLWVGPFPAWKQAGRLAQVTHRQRRWVHPWIVCGHWKGSLPAAAA